MSTAALSRKTSTQPSTGISSFLPFRRTTSLASNGPTQGGTQSIGIPSLPYIPSSIDTTNSFTSLAGRNFHVDITSTNENQGLTTNAPSATNLTKPMITFTNASTHLDANLAPISSLPLSINYISSWTQTF
jgi:hypothetical protein